MKAVYNLGLKRLLERATDDFGNPVVGYAPVVDLPVFAVAPWGSTEPMQGRDETDTRVEVFCPPATVLSARDVLVIDGLDYDVIGVVADYTRGPFGSNFGVVYTARRVEG